jgi:hypothetical protein
MHATELSPEIWNAISDLMHRVVPGREITFGKVVKRDRIKKLIWLKEFGDLSIPLCYFTNSVHYFDTVPVGVVTSGQPVNTELRERKDPDLNLTHQRYWTKVQTPRVGQMAVILNSRGTDKFPICIGVIQSKGYWKEVD